MPKGLGFISFRPPRLGIALTTSGHRKKNKKNTLCALGVSAVKPYLNNIELIKPANLKAVRRGIENEPRDVGMYLIRSMRAEPLMRVGANFGLNQYSSVSSTVIRVKKKLQKNKKFRDRLQYIERNILKGQT